MFLTHTKQLTYLLTYLLTYGAEPFFGSWQLCSHSRTSQNFMEPEGSLPCSQEPSTGHTKQRTIFFRARLILLYRILLCRREFWLFLTGQYSFPESLEAWTETAVTVCSLAATVSTTAMRQQYWTHMSSFPWFFSQSENENKAINYLYRLVWNITYV
jgi:hypothetical protein